MTDLTTVERAGRSKVDQPVAKVGRVIVYRRNGDGIFLKWYNPERGARGNYQRRSARTCELRKALALAADLNDALETGAPEPDRAAFGPSVMEAALAHPATRREREERAGDHKRHLTAVQDYIRFARSPHLMDMTVDRVSEWVAELAKRGLAFDTRRHSLVLLRRASAMAPSFNLPGVLNGLRLDRRMEAIEVKALDLASLKSVLAKTRETAEARWTAAVALMGLMGLRPSEAVRVWVCDVRGGFLYVGENGAKNDPSKRALPMPQIVQDIVKPLIHDRPEQDPLLGVGGTEGSAQSTVSRMVGKVLEQAGFSDLPCKALRKSFATVCVNELGADPALVEGFLGHKNPAALNVTRRHYLKMLNAEGLRPLARMIDEAFAESV